ncbi:MAG: YncE family protein [Bacteroidales bacterium]
MKTRLNNYVLALLIVILYSACTKEEDTIYTPTGPYANGAFISNEGTFGQANASVSFYDYTGDSIRNSIFTTVNNKPLGQVLQSMYTVNGKVYMVLNLSDTVVIANARTFKQEGIISGLNSPRYMTSLNNKGYITQWGEWGEKGVVKVVNLSTKAILSSIGVGVGPEQAIVTGGKIIVANGGAYDVDSTVSVIDPATDQVVKTVEVGHNPKEMVVDKNNDIWIICYGYIKYDGSFNIILETPSKLVKLSGATLEKTNEYIISPTQHPQHIDISKDRSTIYYGGGFGYAGIYAMKITDAVLPTTTLIDGTRYFYGFNVNPANGDIYALDATNFTSQGLLVRYSPQGLLVREYSVGIAPNGAIFR